jgi:CheY-like chemotaxis protein
MVMEFVEGGNLREILKIRKTLAVPEALRILEDATAGLTYAYSRGVTHRDIKLTNLLISSQGQAKLVDFGLAQLFASMSKEQGDDPVDRTVDYAGLERATGVKTGDIRSDIYFLGCVFYEMLTGRPPLSTTKDKNQRMQKRRFEEVEPLRPEQIQAPPSMFLMVETMMALDPHRRYQTPSQLLDAVRRVRRDLEGKDAKSGVAHSVFIAEADERLQGALREKLKGLGYRVFLAADPARALDRFRQQPYDALVVDVASTGEDGLAVFGQVLDEAKRKNLPCAGIAILAQDQSDWAERLPQEPNAAVLVQPGVTLKVLHRKLTELLKAE